MLAVSTIYCKCYAICKHSSTFIGGYWSAFHISMRVFIGSIGKVQSSLGSGALTRSPYLHLFEFICQPTVMQSLSSEAPRQQRTNSDGEMIRLNKIFEDAVIVLGRCQIFFRDGQVIKDNVIIATIVEVIVLYIGCNQLCIVIPLFKQSPCIPANTYSSGVSDSQAPLGQSTTFQVLVATGTMRLMQSGVKICVNSHRQTNHRRS